MPIISGIAFGMIISLIIISFSNKNFFETHTNAIITLSIIYLTLFIVFEIMWLCFKNSLNYDTKEEYLNAMKIECKEDGRAFSPQGWIFFNDNDKKLHDIGYIIGWTLVILTICFIISCKLKEQYNKRYERQLNEICNSIQICKNSKYKPLQELYPILKEAERKIRMQIEFEKVSRGVNVIKQIQSQNNEIDIQTEVDKLNAFKILDTKVDDIDKLIKKYDKKANK